MELVLCVNVLLIFRRGFPRVGPTTERARKPYRRPRSTRPDTQRRKHRRGSDIGSNVCRRCSIHCLHATTTSNSKKKARGEPSPTPAAERATTRVARAGNGGPRNVPFPPHYEVNYKITEQGILFFHYLREWATYPYIIDVTVCYWTDM